MTQLGTSIKKLHSDWGGEHLDKDFISYLKSKDTEQKLTVHDTPSQNGVAKCCNCTIVEWICALLHASGLRQFLWGEAAQHVVWLMNWMSTKAVDGMTPYEAAFRKKPDLRNVCEWGECVWIWTENGDKLGGHVREGQWIGIDEQSKGVWVYWPDKTIVSVERNDHYNNSGSSAPLIKGENDILIKMMADSPKDTVPAVPPNVPTIIEPPTAPPTPPEHQQTEATTSKCIQKPSQWVLDILESNSTLPCGIQTPTNMQPPESEQNDTIVLEGEGQSNWMMNVDFHDGHILAADVMAFSSLHSHSVLGKEFL